MSHKKLWLNCYGDIMVQFADQIQNHAMELKDITKSISELKKDIAVVIHRQDTMGESQKTLMSRYEDLGSLYQKISGQLDVLNKSNECKPTTGAVELAKIDKQTIILFATLVIVGIVIGQSGLIPDIFSLIH